MWVLSGTHYLYGFLRTSSCNGRALGSPGRQFQSHKYRPNLYQRRYRVQRKAPYIYSPDHNADFLGRWAPSLRTIPYSTFIR